MGDEEDPYEGVFRRVEDVDALDEAALESMDLEYFNQWQMATRKVLDKTLPENIPSSEISKESVDFDAIIASVDELLTVTTEGVLAKSQIVHDWIIERRPDFEKAQECIDFYTELIEKINGMKTQLEEQQASEEETVNLLEIYREIVRVTRKAFDGYKLCGACAHAIRVRGNYDPKTYELEKDSRAVWAQAEMTAVAIATPTLNFMQDTEGQILHPDFDDSVLLLFWAFKWSRQTNTASLPTVIGECRGSGDVERAKAAFRTYQSPERLRKFAIHGGPRGGHFCQAGQIYERLLAHQAETEGEECSPLHERLALAIALELCDARLDVRPVNPEEPIDPIERYEFYKESYAQGLLDPAFDHFTVWELRMIVNSDAPTRDLKWGRETMLNYRPDFLVLKDKPHPVWRYCRIVWTDVNYVDLKWYKDPPSYDQLLSDGGKCGPQAWYGRFSCHMFGIPTWGCRQPGHAALGRWLPVTGNMKWSTCLGYKGFEKSTSSGRHGRDFIAEAKARLTFEAEDGYLSHNEQAFYKTCLIIGYAGVCRNEGRNELNARGIPADPDRFKMLWHSLEWCQRRKQIGVAFPLEGEGNAEPDMASVEYMEFPDSPNKFIEALTLQEGESPTETIAVQEDGSILIPATSCSSPTAEEQDPYAEDSDIEDNPEDTEEGVMEEKITQKSQQEYQSVVFMKSWPREDEGPSTTTQLLYKGHYKDAEKQAHMKELVYSFEEGTVAAGAYEVTLMVCTVHRKPEQVTLNVFGAESEEEPIVEELTVDLPYTEGSWQASEPVTLELPADAAKLVIKRVEMNHGGIAMKYVLLKPV